jgi:hypothetical protein
VTTSRGAWKKRRLVSAETVGCAPICRRRPKEVREKQARTIGAIYGLIRRVNDRVEQMAS